MGFQIIDDILDFGHVGVETGKPTGSDLSQGIYTLPAILGLLRDDGRLAASLARRLARAYTERSLREIGRLPSNSSKDILAEVADRLLYRSY